VHGWSGGASPSASGVAVGAPAAAPCVAGALRGLSMMQLAVQSELSLSAVDSLEHGRTIPTVRTADALATALDLEAIDQIDLPAMPPVPSASSPYRCSFCGKQP
jgi:transcriptional regulator with XRE-family HTH domain